MQTRKIGSLDVSVVGLGCNNFGWSVDEAATMAIVDAALDAGVTFFDTADIYGGTRSEEFLGRALGSRRNKVVIATKFGDKVEEGKRGAAPAYIRQAIEDSLRRLGTDRIDLYQLHRPDPAVPIEDTLGALSDLVRAGKVREIGASNFPAEQIRRADAAGRRGPRFVSVQNEYSLLHREPEGDVIPECEDLRIGFLPYFPLANGLLTGKYGRNKLAPAGTRIATVSYFSGLLSGKNLETVEGLAAFAQSKGHSLLELAVSWLLARRVVASVIAGATAAGQVRANAAAAEWTLSAEDLKTIDSLAPPS